MLYDLLTHLTTGGFAGILMLLFLAVAEAGYRCRVGAAARIEATRAQIGAVQAAILGLLALLMGFSFAMSAGRYETRAELVLAEANAIGTAYLRTDLLPQPERSLLADGLRRYVDIRLAIYQPHPELSRRELVQVTIAESERLLADLWELAVTAAEKDPRPATAVLFIPALNQVIDLHGSRVRAISNHVPAFVLFLLIIVAGAALAVVGYSCRLGERRVPAAMVALPVLLALVIAVIVDLDQPLRGFIRVSEQPLLDLQRSLAGTS